MTRTNHKQATILCIICGIHCVYYTLLLLEMAYQSKNYIVSLGMNSLPSAPLKNFITKIPDIMYIEKMTIDLKTKHIIIFIIMNHHTVKLILFQLAL